MLENRGNFGDIVDYMDKILYTPVVNVPMNLFTFLRHLGVPPTNNHAEQSIQHLVIFRKIFFGTRSENGLKTHSILPSLIQTARRQGVHPRKYIQPF
jgi:hypothetical protein